jgi:hypothetical protein
MNRGGRTTTRRANMALIGLLLTSVGPLGGMKRVLVFTRLVQAVRVKGDVSRLLPFHADEDTMRQVDLALRTLFLTPEELALVAAKDNPSII